MGGRCMLENILSFLSDFALVFVLHVMGASSFPKPLTREREAEELAKLKNGDMQARAVLIEHNLRLVAHIVKKYYALSSDQDDLVSIGTIGLIKAVDTFDGEKNTKLSSYAARCIENEVLMYFRNKKKSSLDISLDDAIDTDKDGNPLTLMDIMPSQDNIFEEIDLKINTEKLYKYINELPERERKIIVLRYGLDGSAPLTQREVADILDISRSYVSRIEKKALSRLHEMFN